MSSNVAVLGLVVRPEDLIHSCLAYTRPEMLAFDAIIQFSSSNAPRVQPPSSLLSLPTEVLLHIRTQLQIALASHIATDTRDALAEYELALVDGLCEDCFVWNCDIYGADVWDWVESGYKHACDCCVNGIDLRVATERKLSLVRNHRQAEVKTRRDWLEAHIAQRYLDGQEVWEMVGEVLRSSGCLHSVLPQQPAPQSPSSNSCDFGENLLLTQRDGHPPVMPKILSRELCLDAAQHLRVPKAERSAERFAHLLSKRARVHIANGSPCPEDCALCRWYKTSNARSGFSTNVLTTTAQAQRRQITVLSLLSTSAVVLVYFLLNAAGAQSHSIAAFPPLGS